MKRNYVSVGVAQPNLPIIFSCYAISLVRFGIWFVNGWVSILRIPQPWWITSFNLVLWQVIQRRGVLLCT